MFIILTFINCVVNERITKRTKTLRKRQIGFLTQQTRCRHGIKRSSSIFSVFGDKSSIHKLRYKSISSKFRKRTVDDLLRNVRSYSKQKKRSTLPYTFLPFSTILLHNGNKKKQVLGAKEVFWWKKKINFVK